MTYPWYQYVPLGWSVGMSQWYVMHSPGKA